MDSSEAARRAARVRDLHVGRDMLVLLDAWDRTPARTSHRAHGTR